MRIDERLDRLTERHEALTQTVELIVSMQRDHELRTAKEFSEIAKQFSEMTKQFSNVMEAINGLARIAEVYERRQPPGGG